MFKIRPVNSDLRFPFIPSPAYGNWIPFFLWSIRLSINFSYVVSVAVCLTVSISQSVWLTDCLTVCLCFEVTVKNLPSVKTPSVCFLLFFQRQAALSMTLASLHYDSLFDYALRLPDEKGRLVVEKYYKYLQGYVKPTIEQRNVHRFEQGYLPYPYLLPKWIANSIHT